MKSLTAILVLALVSLNLVDSNEYGGGLVDCHPEPGATEDDCVNVRKCIWDETYKNLNGPSCYLPPNTGYVLSDIHATTYTLIKNVTTDKHYQYGDEFDTLNLDINHYGGILNIRISPAGHERYEPPLDLPRKSVNTTEKLMFYYIGTTEFFSFLVLRDRTNAVLFDTRIGGLTFADQFIQIGTFLQSDQIYGFGEQIHKSFKHNLKKYITWPMFARDEAPDSVSELNAQNLYGVHPFYICVEGPYGGDTHGVLILNSNAQEVTLGPGPSMVYRAIGGMLDIYFFPGPSPSDVISQYLNFIGTPFLPAYWALGFQLCRWGYTSLDDMKEAVARTRNAQIPLDVPYADIDYMRSYEDFTEAWVGFDEYVKQLQSDGLHVILIFDPAIEADYDSFNRSETAKVSYIDWPSHDFVSDVIENNYTMIKDKNIMLGNVWPHANAAFPDFLDPEDNTRNWWISEFRRFHEHCPFDGIWIDMNEPSNFNTSVYDRSVDPKPPVTVNFQLACPVGKDYNLDDPKYSTWAVYYKAADQEYLSSKTLCMIGMTGRNTSRFYDTKNLYGWAEAKATAAALTAINGNKRGAIISRSTFVSSGRYGGHWLGDNSATWEDLKTAVIGVMEFNMFGIPYVGSDICGFNGNTTAELCLRWHQLGAFHPFARNHNAKDTIAQDPAQWPSVEKAARDALMLRYRLLPHLYSLMYSAHLKGDTVIRPLFFEFPTDTKTLEIDDEFMWGSTLLIAPILTQGVSSRQVYFPRGSWYSIRSNDYGQLIDGSEAGLESTVSAPLDWNTPVFLLGGKIIPTQAPAVTTTLSRNNPFGLLIALETNGVYDDVYGELYWDDGTVNDDVSYYHWTFQFTATRRNSTLIIKLDHKPQASLTLPTLDTIDIFGYVFDIYSTSFLINGVSKPITDPSMVVKNKTTKVLQLNIKNFLNISESITVFWKHGYYTTTKSSLSPTPSLLSSTTSFSCKTSSYSALLSFLIISFALLIREF